MIGDVIISCDACGHTWVRGVHVPSDEWEAFKYFYPIVGHIGCPERSETVEQQVEELYERFINATGGNV